MLQIHDIREPGLIRMRGSERGDRKAWPSRLPEWPQTSMAAEQIASILELDVEMVRKIIARIPPL